MANFKFYHPIPMIVNDTKTSADQCDAAIWQKNLRLHVLPANTSISIPDLNIGDLFDAIKAALIAEIEAKRRNWEHEPFMLGEFSGHCSGLLTSLVNHSGETKVTMEDVPYRYDDDTPLDELPVEDVYQIYQQVLAI